jgi:hypothetical protein
MQYNSNCYGHGHYNKVRIIDFIVVHCNPDLISDEQRLGVSSPDSHDSDCSVVLKYCSRRSYLQSHVPNIFDKKLSVKCTA